VFWTFVAGSSRVFFATRLNTRGYGNRRSFVRLLVVRLYFRVLSVRSPEPPKYLYVSDQYARRVIFPPVFPVQSAPILFVLFKNQSSRITSRRPRLVFEFVSTKMFSNAGKIHFTVNNTYISAAVVARSFQSFPVAVAIRVIIINNDKPRRLQQMTTSRRSSSLLVIA